MKDDRDITEVRGSVVRCSGPAEHPHRDTVIKLPVDAVVACPDCGRRFRRASWWNVISGAIWPEKDVG